MNANKDPNFLLSTMDAQEWATEYCRLNPTADHGTMLGWFANAIMTGFDEGARRARMPGAEGVHAWEYYFIHSSATGHGDMEVGPCLTYDKNKAFGIGCIKQREVRICSLLEKPE